MRGNIQMWNTKEVWASQSQVKAVLIDVKGRTLNIDDEQSKSLFPFTLTNMWHGNATTNSTGFKNRFHVPEAINAVIFLYIKKQNSYPADYKGFETL